MKKVLTQKHTAVACYTGYVIQAIVNTLTPLFYATFNTDFSISLEKIGLIATVNFFTQIILDLLSPLIEKSFGIRKATHFSHVFCFIGLILLGILPLTLKNKFLSIIIPTFFMAVGGGLLEVFISPIIEAIPSDKKESDMSLLHSFYGFGQCAVVLLSSFFFLIFNVKNWYFLPFVWAIIPFLNIFLFLNVPLFELPSLSEEKNVSMIKTPLFWLLFVMMISAGATELAISTWASAFAELGLKVNKTVGDILGPCLFALFLGTGRLLNASLLKKIKLETCFFVFSLSTVICYLVAIFVPNPFITLLGCAFSGFFVSIMWPGTYSIGANKLKNSGTLMFSLFAFGGDIGCSLGSYLVGLIGDLTKNGRLSILKSILPVNGFGIRAGLLICLIFPLISTLSSLFLLKRKNNI